MKTRFTHLATVLLCGVLAAAHAAVPVVWTNTPAATQPYPIKPVPHGSTVDLAVTLKGYTTPPIADGADVRLWYQTNGMGSAWWSAPATFDGSTITASFGPAQDCGADRVSLFFGAPSNVFASAVLRLTHAPGFSPSSLPLPVQRLDFAAVEIANAPYYTKAETESKIAELAPAPGDYLAVSNAAMSAAAATNDFLRLSGGMLTGDLSLAGSASIRYTGVWWVRMYAGVGEAGNRIYTNEGDTWQSERGLAWFDETTNHVYAAAVAATNYTDSATNALGSVLRASIAESTPGNYLAVSNAAMHAVTFDEYGEVTVDRLLVHDLAVNGSPGWPTYRILFGPNDLDGTYLYWDADSGRFATWRTAYGGDYLATANDLTPYATTSWTLDAYGSTNLLYDVAGGTWLRLVEADGASTNVLWDQRHAVTNLSAAYVRSGVLSAERIPGLAASKITSGTLSAERVPVITSAKIADGTIVNADVSASAAISGSKLANASVTDAKIASVSASKVTREGVATNVVMYATGVLDVSIADGAALNASTNGWPDGAAVFARLAPAGSYTVDSALLLAGYGFWPTNSAQCVFWRSGAAVYCTVLLEEAGR